MLTSAPRRSCAPSFLRPVVPAPRRSCAPSFLLLNSLLVMASLLLTASAEAGSYLVAFSGGSIACVGGVKSPFTRGSGYCANASIPFTGRGLSGRSISCPDPNSSSGPVVATFTWTHTQNSDGTMPTDATDPPPSCTIVTQSATVTWQTQEGQTTTGSVDAGQTSSTPASTTAGQGPNVSLNSMGTSYSVGAGGDSFSVTAKPGPSASLSGSSGDVTIQYSAGASPITIIPNGAKQDSTTGAYSLLTGQQVSTGLTGVPFAPGTGSTYQWSAGGDTFYTYNEKAPSHQLVLLSDAPSYTTSPGFSFYDKSAETVTITCKAVLVCPDGTSLTLNPSSQPITVKKPSVTKWDIHTGYVQHVQNPTTGQKGYQLRQAPTSTQTGGEAWQNATIVVPAPFTATGGTGCIAQLATPNIVVTNDDPTKSPVFPNNNQQGLDNSFPYQGDQWDISSLGAGADSPVLYYENYNSGGYSGWTQVSDTDTFTTWVMYQPPGGVWVPLQSYDWNWSFTSQWSTSQNQWNLFRARPSPTSGDPGYTGADTPTPPQWNLVQNNTPAPSK